MRFVPIPATISGRTKLACGFMIVGLLVEFVSLFWVHPFAFMVHLCVGLPFVGLGILYFLLAAVLKPAIKSDKGEAA